MDLKVLPSSRIMVDVRSKGILGALEHEITFGAPAEACVIASVPESGRFEAGVAAKLAVAALEPPADASRFDRDKMLENLRGDDTLAMKRWPELELRGRYEGDLEGGTLRGELTVRGTPRPIAFDVRVTKRGEGYRADARWEGTLTQLGVKPFKALLGALQLRDFCRIRLAVDLAP